MQNLYKTPSSSIPSSVSCAIELPSGLKIRENKCIVYFTEFEFVSDGNTPLAPGPKLVPMTTHLSSVAKKACLEGGQTTLTQVLNDETKHHSPPVCPFFFCNEDLKVILREYRNKCQDLIEELKDMYYYFDDATFKQEKFFTDRLDSTMIGIDCTVGTVSIMGLPDMQCYFPGHEYDLNVLVKNLSVHKCFSLLTDVDLFSNEVKIHTSHIV